MGVSGKRAIIVWKRCQEERPREALRVSLPSLGAIAWPVSMGWEGFERLSGAGDGAGARGVSGKGMFPRKG